VTRLVTGDCCCAWRPLCGWTSTSVTFASLLAAEDTLVTADRLRARHSVQVSQGASQQPSQPHPAAVSAAAEQQSAEQRSRWVRPAGQPFCRRTGDHRPREGDHAIELDGPGAGGHELKTAGGRSSRTWRRSAPQAARRLSCRIHSWARTREDPFCRWWSEIWPLGVRFGAVVCLGGRA